MPRAVLPFNLMFFVPVTVPALATSVYSPSALSEIVKSSASVNIFFAPVTLYPFASTTVIIVLPPSAIVPVPEVLSASV